MTRKKQATSKLSGERDIALSKLLRSHSISIKITRRLLLSLATGFILFWILNTAGRYSLNQRLLQTGYFQTYEKDRLQSLQEYVAQNKIRSTDLYKLHTWAKEKNIRSFIIAANDQYLEVAMDWDKFPKQMSMDSAAIWLAPIQFHDGEFSVYLYEGEAEHYYLIVAFVTGVIAFLTGLYLFLEEVNTIIRSVLTLHREVKEIDQGNLDIDIFKEGDDELADLAQGLDHMRLTLISDQKTRDEMRRAEEKMVLGMAHDLRTPLTGLMAYMDLVKKEQERGTINPDHLAVISRKITEIRVLSDQMFEYFLVSSSSEGAPIQLEEPETLENALADYLSDMCGILYAEGFTTDTDGLDFRPVKIQIYTDYIGRINNNLISNIRKYAATDVPVKLAFTYTESDVTLSISNAVKDPSKYIKGTGIGVENIRLMMEQMHGTSHVSIDPRDYEIDLTFPLAEKGG